MQQFLVSKSSTATDLHKIVKWHQGTLSQPGCIQQSHVPKYFTLE